MARVFLYPPMTEQAQADLVVPRLAWYFRPHLDRIASIVVQAEAGLIAAATRPADLDPAIDALMPAIRPRIEAVGAERFAALLAGIDPARDLLLLWDVTAEETAPEAVRAAIRALGARGGLYRVDPLRTRMEGSFYLWAGLNRFGDPAGVTAESRARLARMVAEIGPQRKAYVFGTGPSLSDFVEGHDFGDGLCIVANSIVKNRDILARTRPRIVVAADPLYHAGCSSYAGAFRAELVAALEETGAWFVCPLRDFAIYDSLLPEALRPRLIGIPFDKAAPPPADLARTFHLRPYPNVLTLGLLPLAATFAPEIVVVGCDGRALTDDAFFWSHDRKAQFNDRMDDIQSAHPAFFAIDYNDYYTEHCRDLEEVLSTLEAAGRRVVTATPSLIPALQAREPARPAPAPPTAQTPGQPPAQTPGQPPVLAMIDPDARDDWGHFLAYDKRLAEGCQARGLEMVLIGRRELEARHVPATIARFLPVFGVHSWTVGNKWPAMERGAWMTFGRELDAALQQIEQAYPERDILIFMYIGSFEVAELLEFLLAARPRMRAVVNLFWSYNFDEADPDYRARWLPVLRRLRRGGRIRPTHSTPQIAADFRDRWGIELPVLPHPSTTFGDREAGAMAGVPVPVRAPTPTAIPTPTPAPTPTAATWRVVFPGGARSEKGFVLSVGAAAALAPRPGLLPVLRARVDKVSGKRLAEAFAALDRTGIEVIEGDLDDAGFIAMIAGADVVVIPYSAEAFRRRTSGILVDCVLLGRPVVVLEGTWLADIVAQDGIGVVAPPTVAGIVAAVDEVIRRHGDFRDALQRARQSYPQQNSWARLVGFLADQAGLQLPRPAPAVPTARIAPAALPPPALPSTPAAPGPAAPGPAAPGIAGQETGQEVAARSGRDPEETWEAVRRRLRRLAPVERMVPGKHVVPGLWLAADTEQGALEAACGPLPGGLMTLRARVRRPGRWLSLNASLGDGALGPDDLLGLVCALRAPRPVSCRLVLRVARPGGFENLPLSDEIVAGPDSAPPDGAPHVATLSAREWPILRRPAEWRNLMLLLPRTDFEIVLQDLRLFVLEGASLRPSAPARPAAAPPAAAAAAS